MKSKWDFDSETEYNEYLKYYYAGLAMGALIPTFQKNNGSVVSAHVDKKSVELAYALIKALNDKQ